MGLRRMMIAMSLGNFVKGLIKAFKVRVLGDGGQFEVESCLETQLNDINDEGLLSTASVVVTPNGYSENNLYSVVKNDGTTDLEITRATTATRINSNKLVEITPYNLFRYSENFENAYWIKPAAAVTPNAAVSPKGDLTADLVIPNTVSGEHQLQPSTGTIPLLVSQTSQLHWSVYVKAAGNNFFILRTQINGLWTPTIFNIASGTIVSTGSGFVSSNIENVGNGWFLISVVTQNITSAWFQHISSPTGAVGFAGDGVSGAYIWGAQLVAGSQPKDYFRVTDRFKIPRLDYTNSTCPAILVEPVMTNNWTLNNDTTGYSTNTNAIKGNQILDAFGLGVNGYEYTFYSTGQIFVSSAYSIRVFDTRTYPVNRLCLYIKNPSSDYFSIKFTNVAQATFRFSDLTSYDSNGIIVKISNDTYALYVHNDTSVMGQFSQVRCSFVSGFSVNPAPINGTATLGLGFWHRATTNVQVSNVYSPIITTAVAITRNGDVYSKSLATDIIGQTQGTIFIDFERTKIPGGIKALLTMYSVINDETFHIQTSNDQVNLNIAIVSVSNGVSVNRITTLLDGRNKIAVVYSTTGTKIFLNGVQLAPLANTALPVMNVLHLSHRTSQRIYGNIYQFVLWKTQITDQQAINLTTL